MTVAMNPYAHLLSAGLLDTGAAAGVPAQPEAFFPLTSTAWSKAVYSYNTDSHIGTFENTKGELLIAPETGQLYATEDGGFILRVEDGDGVREWMGGQVAHMSQMFGHMSGVTVQAGAPLGRLTENLTLSLWTTPKGESAAFPVDPVPILQEEKALFRDKLDAGQPQVSQSTVIQRVEDSNIILGGKKEFTPMHMLLASLAGIFMGGLFVMAVRKR